MTTITVNGISLPVKDYLCRRKESDYMRKPAHLVNRLWLYVNVTNRCNASCPFCIAGPAGTEVLDPETFLVCFDSVKDHVAGVSLTGGEPMLYPELVNTLILGIRKRAGEALEIDLASNGTNLDTLRELPALEELTAIHLSRHTITDRSGENGAFPEEKKIAEFISSLQDPGKVVFNCILSTDSIHDMDGIAQYLDRSIRIGVRNNSFIQMMRPSWNVSWWENHMVRTSSLPLMQDPALQDWNETHRDRQFHIWHREQDYEYCHCATGSYRNAEGSTLFYVRAPGNEKPPDYARQLVYGPDNCLRAGFGKARVLWCQRSAEVN